MESRGLAERERGGLPYSHPTGLKLVFFCLAFFMEGGKNVLNKLSSEPERRGARKTSLDDLRECSLVYLYLQQPFCPHGAPGPEVSA